MKAHVFSNVYTGTQIYVWNEHNWATAKDTFKSVVKDVNDWKLTSIVSYINGTVTIKNI